MKKEFSKWYSSIVHQNFTTSNDENPPPMDLRMSIMKPLGAQWHIKAYSHLQINSTIIANGFKAAGITDILLYVEHYTQPYTHNIAVHMST